MSPKPVLFVTSDYDALLVNAYRALLEDVFLYPFISMDVLACCLEKDRTVELAKAAGVGHPRTWLLDADDPRSDIADVAGFPCVVRPCAWVEFDGAEMREKTAFRRAFACKAVRASRPDDLADIVTRVEGIGVPLVVQEEIPGPSDRIFGASVYANSSCELDGTYTCRKTRQLPSDFGTGTMVESMVLPELAELCARFCRTAGFHGIAEFEFKRDSRDGQLKIIEINPRPGTWISAAPASGVNTPFLAYCDLSGKPLPQEKQSEELVRWCDGWPDLEYFTKNRKGDHTGRPMSLRDYLASRRGRYEYAYFALEDIRPSLRRLRPVVKDLAGRTLRKPAKWLKGGRTVTAIEAGQSAIPAGSAAVQHGTGSRTHRCPAGDDDLRGDR